MRYVELSSGSAGVLLAAIAAGLGSNLALPRCHGGAPAVPVVTGFDTGLEGWTSNVPAEVSWSFIGGNPGGYVHFVDASGSGSHLVAPGSYLGDWSSLEDVGSIQYDHRVIQHSGSQTASYQVAISGPGGAATWAGPVASQTAGPWIPVAVPLTEEAWCVTAGTWAAILADVTELTVEIELVFGVPDVEGVDNVVLTGAGGSACVADVDFDGNVGITDFLLLLAEWSNEICLPPDLDGDGIVGILDFLILLAAWGPCP